VTFALKEGESYLSKEWFIEVINVWIQVIGILMSMATYLATMFLSPEWINGSLFWLDEKLKGIWILVSNLVYFIFAFILIWIAFMNIIWKTWEMYELKKALPKFIVWVLIVPFSWFFVQFILSISAILTVSALTLPYETFQEYWTQMSEIKVPKDCTINTNAIKSDKKDKTSSDQIFTCTMMKISWEDSTDSIFWIFSLYTYWILKLDSFDDLSKDLMLEWWVATLWDIVVKVLFSAIFILVYGILIITLTLVLLIRWIYIWIYIMLSPVFWLMYFFWKSEWWGWFTEKFNIKEFISLAMIPVYTMLALSFWILFIHIVWKWLATSSSLDNKISLGFTEWASHFKLGDHKLIIKWPVSETTKADLTELLWTIEKEWGWALWLVWNLILKIFGIIVLRWAIMTAMRASKITEQITQPIYDFWNQVWKIAASWPWNLPIFGGQSMNSMKTAAWSVQSAITTSQNKKWTKFWQNFIPWNELDKKYRDIYDEHTTNADDALKYIKKTMWTWTIKELASSKNGIDSMVKHLWTLNNNNWFNDKEQAKKLIEKLKNKWLWNEWVIDEILTDLDALGIASKTILWWDNNIKKWNAHKYMWSAAIKNNDSKGNLKPKFEEAGEKWIDLKVSIWSDTSYIERDSDRNAKWSELKQLISLIVWWLNDWIWKENFELILNKFWNWEEIAGEIYYDKDSGKYSIEKPSTNWDKSKKWLNSDQLFEK